MEKDPVVEGLFVTARAMIVEGKTPAGMLTGWKEEQEKVVVLLPWEEGEVSDGMIKYMSAITLALALGADTIYEMRDTFMLRVPVENKGKTLEELNLPLPSESPESVEALMVTVTDVTTGHQHIFMQKYGRDDWGNPSFEEVEDTSYDGTGGRLGPVVRAALEAWKETPESARPALNKEEAKFIMGKIGLVGMIR